MLHFRSEDNIPITFHIPQDIVERYSKQEFGIVWVFAVFIDK
jgi:hypothetical protein